MIDKVCEICSKTFGIHKDRISTAKWCSTKCAALGRKAPAETTCDGCSVMFHRKPSHRNRANTLGQFCSVTCLAVAKSTHYTGDRNPNFKGRNTDHDGYILSIPASDEFSHLSKKLHKAVALRCLGFTEIPKGYHVHHRDCDKHNNLAENLAVLSISDHIWLHKQYGNATLWAYMRGKIDLESLVAWSDNKDLALKLLPLNVINQSKNEIGVVKDGELLETPVADNQQPSLGGDPFEGSETSDRPSCEAVMLPRAPSTER